MNIGELNEKYKGKRFLILKPHPHEGELAEFEQWRNTPIGLGMVVKGDYNSYVVYNLAEAKEI